MSNLLFSAEPVQREISLGGISSYQIQNNRVLINIDSISNNRNNGNLSGTLTIELWALAQPYHGGGFNGIALAATSIGEISGQHFLSSCEYDLLFNEPPAGNWYLCLMLREWENGVYVTRDYMNFSLPYVVAPIARSNVRVMREENNNVINVAFSGSEVQAKVTNEKAAPAAKKSQTVTVEKAAITKKVTAEPKLSINAASLKELEAIKGVSKKLAKNIVEGRPYKAIEQLLDVRGMGKKLLENLESKLKL